MYALIKTGGKQFRVSKGDVIDIEKLEGEKDGKLTFEQVLMIGGDKEMKIGRPFIDGVTVSGTIESQFKDKKIIVYKKKKRKGYEKRQGHRQQKTKVKITAINA